MASEHRILSELHYAAGRLASLVCDARDGSLYDDHEHSEWMLRLVLRGLERIGVEAAEAQRDELAAALRGVLRESDRKTDAYDRAHAALAALDRGEEG